MGTSTKMYRLESTSNIHQSSLTQVLQSCTISSPDLCLITRDGHAVYTTKILLAMHSKMMAQVMSDSFSEEFIRISVPISSNSLVNLIKILSHGITKSEVKFDPMDVLNAAGILGISLDDLQIGSKGDEEGTGTDYHKKTGINMNKKIKIEPKQIDIMHDIHRNQDQSIAEASELDSTEFETGRDFEPSDGSSAKETVNHPDKKVERNFECDQCEWKFKTPQKLNTHMVTHTGERPFQCSKCNKCFSQKVNLERHSILHTDLKPFKCEDCGKGFNRNDNLRKHAKTHTKD